MAIRHFSGVIPSQCNICLQDETEKNKLIETTCCTNSLGTAIIPRTYHKLCFKEYVFKGVIFNCPFCRKSLDPFYLLTMKDLIGVKLKNGIKKIHGFLSENANLIGLSAFLALPSFLIESGQIIMPNWKFQTKIFIAAASTLTFGISKIAFDRINNPLERPIIGGFIFSFHLSTLSMSALYCSDVGLSIAQELLHMNKATPIGMTTRAIASSLVQLTSIFLGKIIYNKRHLLGI